METRRVTFLWEGRDEALDRDILTILTDPWPSDYGADPSEEDIRLVFYRLLDDEEEATGDIVGVEIDDFLDFDLWAAIPNLPRKWQLPDQEPRSLVDLLKQLQADLQARFRTPVLA